MSGDWWAFVRQTGLEGREVICLLLGGLLLSAAVILIVSIRRKALYKLTSRDVVAILSASAVSLSFVLMFGFSIRKRYLLQPGKGHYTVGTITEHYWRKGEQNYLLEYFVAGQRWQTDAKCGIENNQNLPCPPIGSRRYVYFAPADPNTAQITAVLVPDSVRVVPPLGWAKLP